MKKLFTPFLISIVLLLSINTFAQQNNMPIEKQRPVDYEYLSAPDSTGKRTMLKMPSTERVTQVLKLPYPIIFIHGLNSNSATWDITTNFMDAQYGFTFGGRFDYCLNYDGDNTKANKDLYPTAGADIAKFPTTTTAGDYYYLNFDVGNNGSVFPTTSTTDYVTSNQSAIVKQGIALKWAIYNVLQATGRDKVILMGHSMGGLAAREYLQNPSNWQADGQSHVAKLTTTGTPHGGSNATSFGVLSSNTDGQSEAIRDLRRTYYYSNNSGVYLFGGQENLPYMEDQLCCYFYNADVNCNGITQENIVGLNQKSIYNNLDYSCIIGECSGCVGTTNPGDGIVWDIQANLNNFYPGLNAKEFYYNASAGLEIHTDLPKQNYQNMQGLDEPNEYDLSYNIDYDTIYTGFTTVQPAGGYPYDYDDYKFNFSATSNVTVNIYNFPTSSDISVYILNSSFQRVDSASHSIGSTTGINFTSTLNAGNYYLEIFATPTSTSYLTPYNFTLHRTLNVTANASSTTVCAGDIVTLTGGGATSYIWTGGVINGVGFIPTGTATYTVTGIDGSANGTATTTITLKPSPCINTAINETESNIRFNVYPNPNNGSFTVSLSGSETEGIYSIINELGQTIQQLKLNSVNNYTMNIDNLNNGVYFIIGFNDHQMTKQKIIVTK